LLVDERDFFDTTKVGLDYSSDYWFEKEQPGRYAKKQLINYFYGVTGRENVFQKQV